LVETGAIPLVVLSRQQDPVEVINSTLRTAGHPVHCTWVRDVVALGEELARAEPQMILLCLSDVDETRAALDTRKRYATQVPTLLVRESISADDLAQALELGAQDVVTLQAKQRLQVVAARELQAARVDQTLAGTLAAARQYRDQMKAFMTGSTDAIAHVQEGIVVDVNPSWAELFGHEDPAAFVGQPLMDFFGQRSHAALRGALVAAAQGRWADHSLQAAASLPGGPEVSVQIELERFDFEGEPAVRLRIATQKRDVETLTGQLEKAMRLDAATGLLRRGAFLEQAAAQAGQALKAGLRAVVYFEPDKLAALEGELGVVVAEDLVDSVGRHLRDQLQPGDAAGRVASHGFAVLVERGNLRDLEAWANGALQRIAEAVFNAGDKSVSLTCSAGTTPLSAQGGPITSALESAVRAARAAASAGGNRLQLPEQQRKRADAEDVDRTWAGRIKSALMANRFRLVQQPIASLVGDGATMFDLVVRMLDDKGNELLPSEFIAAAQRTDLIKNIDRWVIGAAMALCVSRKPRRVFVRLSRSTMRDPTLGPWLAQQLKASGAEARRIVFELHEEVATAHLKETKALEAMVRPLGFQLAIENFGSGRDPAQLLTHVPLNFVKIDGALMQGLANDRKIQDQVKALVQKARDQGISTIAERVEDANTLAVLWQIGVEFVQGYFVNSPEEVVLET
jgi:EAL domain-containing protein (putative c-di-GMP-specific phosphodiesterase class I)/GGDEF domain-containing protein